MISFFFLETEVVHAPVERLRITLKHFILMKDFGAANHLKIIAQLKNIQHQGILKMQTAMARY